MLCYQSVCGANCVGALCVGQADHQHARTPQLFRLAHKMAGLECEATLQDNCASVRIALVPVGSIAADKFRELTALLHPLNKLDPLAVTHGSSDTRRGTLRLLFVEAGGGPSDWDELYPQRRVRAMVGICHCPAEHDLYTSYRAFVQQASSFPSVTQVRCLVFDSPASGLSSLFDGTQLAASDSDRLMGVPQRAPHEQRILIEHLMESLAADLVSDIKAESETHASSVPSTPTDSTSSERWSSAPMLRLLSSASSRLMVRQQKRKADFRLMCGNLADAHKGYERALELLSRTGADAVWHAAALEGLSATSLLLIAQAIDAVPPTNPDQAALLVEQYDVALDAARRRLEEAVGLCVSRGGRALEVAVEIGFRLTRLIAESAERARARQAAEVRDIMGTDTGEFPPPSPWRDGVLLAARSLHRHCYQLAVGSEAPLGHQLQLRVCLAAASLSSELRQERKASFYLLEAARRYHDNQQWLAAHEVLLVAAPRLQLGPLQWLQLRAPWRAPMATEPRLAFAPALDDGMHPAESGEAHPHAVTYRMVDRALNGWSYLREYMLAMLLEL